MRMDSICLETVSESGRYFRGIKHSPLCGPRRRLMAKCCHCRYINSTTFLENTRWIELELSPDGGAFELILSNLQHERMTMTRRFNRPLIVVSTLLVIGSGAAMLIADASSDAGSSAGSEPVIELKGDGFESANSVLLEDEGGAAMTAAATAFTKMLSKEESAKAMLPYDSEKRVGWHFIPKNDRKGLQWKDMSDAQQAAGAKLVRASLSAAGYKKARSIMQLESFLHAVEQGRGNVRDPERYYFTIFGTPAADSKWGLSFEGHHLSLNFVVENNELISNTPTFFAANPGIVKSERLESIPKGTRVLAAEEQVAFRLVKSLSDEQKAKAIFAKKAPKEIRAAGEPQPPSEKAVGIKGSDLKPEQLQMLKRLVTVYASSFPEATRKAEMKKIRSGGWENLHFAWGGATKPGIGHYYRVQGDSVLIEFVNTQPDAEGNPANHIHCVWRNPAGDFALEIGGK